MFDIFFEKNFKNGYPLISDLIKNCKRINKNDIDNLFKIKEKELINTFLENYEHFSKNNLRYIERKINNLIQNNNIDNIDYISDLIDFCTSYGLDLNYETILDFIKNKNEHFVILSSLQYLSENIKYYYIEEIFDCLKYIISSNHSDNLKIISFLILFKISHSNSYVENIKQLLNNEENISFFTNRINKYDFEISFFSKKKILKDLLETNS